MNKYCLLFLIALFLRIGCFSQVIVTGGTNTTPNLAPTYTSLALAITALNTITLINGPVSILLSAGNTQIAPSGGYVIQFSATTTAANYVEIYGSGNTIAAFTPQPAGSLNDAIFKLVGVDHVHIIVFTMSENSLNINNTPGTNTMTEWGIALLRVNQANGSQYNFFINNTIILNRNYRNTFGIYSNVMHAPATPLVQQDITNASGSNSYNTVLNNTISNVGYGIVLIGSATPAFMDNGNDIGGTSVFTDNVITNWGGNANTLSAYATLGTDNYGIIINNQLNENVSYNTITSGAVNGGTFIFGAILKNYSATPTGTIISRISYNTISLSSANLSGNMTAISSQGINTALSTATILITDNTILNCVISGVGTNTTFTGITNSSRPGILNIINNVIRNITSTATTGGYTGISNTGVVTDSINITDNKLGFNSNPAVTFSVATTGLVHGIINSGAASTAIVNLNFNQFDMFFAVTTGQLFFLRNTANIATTLNVLYNNFGFTNTLVTFSGAQSASIQCINVQNTTATCDVIIQNNSIRGIIHSVTGSAAHSYISSGGSVLNSNISDNNFININVNTSGNISFIVKSTTMPATGTSIINNNRVITAFNKTGAGGQVNFYQAAGSSGNGSTMTETGNNFSNITVTGATSIVGWLNIEGVSGANGPTKTITGNTFDNITGGSNPITIMTTNFGAATNCSSNTITNITGTGAITGISHMSNNGQGTHDYATNSISSLISSGTGGDVKAIVGGATTIATLNINNNIISALSSTGASSTITGIEVSAGSTVNIHHNFMTSLIGTGTGSPLGNGIVVQGGTTVNVFRNAIYSVAENGIIATTSPAVNGILFSGGGTITAYNNFVSNLRAPNANLTDAIRVMSVTSTTPASTYNLYYNSFNVTATSTGANFGTTTLYHAANATATTAGLTLINNIFNNASTPNGTGVVTAFRRSGTTLANYGSTSDHNLYYTGVPAANRLIYADGTNVDQAFSAFQTRVSTREINSLSLLPIFVAISDLHLWTNQNCAIDGRGTPIPGFTIDIDNAGRDPVTPDIGADEINPFYFLNALAGVNGIAVCENKTVSVAGTTFANGPACNLIATVQSSGADPVTGSINACVTLDATQQFFNAEPYVQRHYDIEPVTSNTTTTSATITLYFTDAEFSNFNTINPAWPPLPTLAGGGSTDPNRANLKVTQYHGTPTTIPSTPGNYTANFGGGTYIDPPDANIIWNNWYWAVTFDINGFSGFYVHSNIRYPLPVTLVHFTGIKQGTDHVLNWKINCNASAGITMTLERSDQSNSNFNAIAVTTADAMRCTLPFDHRDAAPLKGMNYYRLRIVDSQGKISYSNTIALPNATSGSALISIAPNPVATEGRFRLNLASARATKMELVIIDMQGRLIGQQNIAVHAGYNSIDMHVGKLAPGTYYIRCLDADAAQKILRFVKQ